MGIFLEYSHPLMKNRYGNPTTNSVAGFFYIIEAFEDKFKVL